jgi:hypothetical protein
MCLEKQPRLYTPRNHVLIRVTNHVLIHMASNGHTQVVLKMKFRIILKAQCQKECIFHCGDIRRVGLWEEEGLGDGGRGRRKGGGGESLGNNTMEKRVHIMGVGSGGLNSLSFRRRTLMVAATPPAHPRPYPSP